MPVNVLQRTHWNNYRQVTSQFIYCIRIRDLELKLSKRNTCLSMLVRSGEVGALGVLGGLGP